MLLGRYRQALQQNGPDILIDNVAGLGIRRKVGVCRYNTLPRLAVEIEIERNELAEELRILYVALTRAREKLMIVGTLANAEKYIGDMASQLMFDTIIDPYTVTGAKKLLDWLTLCALVNPSSRKNMLRGSEQITLREAYPTWRFSLINEPEQLALTPQDEELLRVTDAPSVTETDYAAMLSWNLSYQYPHAAAVGLPQKVSASQIAHQAGSDYFERIVAKPGFRHTICFCNTAILKKRAKILPPRLNGCSQRAPSATHRQS